MKPAVRKKTYNLDSKIVAAARRAFNAKTTFAWLKSWGMLEATASPFDLVDLAVQTQAHHAAE